MMVDVRGTFGAVVAVDCLYSPKKKVLERGGWIYGGEGLMWGEMYLSTISVISIFSRFTTFGDFEGGFGNDLVHGVSSSSEDFARVAVAV